MKYFSQVLQTHTSPKDLWCCTGPLISRQHSPGVLFVDKSTSSYPWMVARCAKCAMAASLTSLVLPLATMATMEGHLASLKVCLGTFLCLVHRLGARPGLAILAATSPRLAPLSKMPTSLYTVTETGSLHWVGVLGIFWGKALTTPWAQTRLIADQMR